MVTLVFIFEKTSIEQLQIMIANQLEDCVPIMAAPDLAQSLLVQYVSDLSRTKGSTSVSSALKCRKNYIV